MVLVTLSSTLESLNRCEAASAEAVTTSSGNSKFWRPFDVSLIGREQTFILLFSSGPIKNHVQIPLSYLTKDYFTNFRVFLRYFENTTDIYGSWHQQKWEGIRILNLLKQSFLSFSILESSDGVLKSHYWTPSSVGLV